MQHNQRVGALTLVISLMIASFIGLVLANTQQLLILLAHCWPNEACHLGCCYAYSVPVTVVWMGPSECQLKNLEANNQVHTTVEIVHYTMKTELMSKSCLKILLLACHFCLCQPFYLCLYRPGTLLKTYYLSSVGSQDTCACKSTATW